MTERTSVTRMMRQFRRLASFLLLMLMIGVPRQGYAQPAVGELTEAEQRVLEIISGEGVHVVHFWAPWCSNCIRELRGGWSDLIAKNEDVSFTFVTVWNEGESGIETLRRFGIPERVLEVVQPDRDADYDGDPRRRIFLGMPMAWIPSTWIYRSNARLAFAMNYGEMEMPVVQALIDATKRGW
jgi:thiol-disulfide isomerase/thioredoxin